MVTPAHSEVAESKGREELTSVGVEEFAASMPRRYRSDIGPKAVRQHARIVQARGVKPVHADLFFSAHAFGPGLCVVAPDAPGLLAAISAALMLEGFDITRADAYTRRFTSGEFEAVDFFWVRGEPLERPRPLSRADLGAVLRSLEELLGRGPRQVVRGGAAREISPGQSETSVRFLEPYDAPWLTLELESNDRPGLLAVVTDALYAENVTIVDCRIRTSGLRVHDAFDLLEIDGTRPAGARRMRIELAVVSAVDGSARGA